MQRQLLGMQRQKQDLDLSLDSFYCKPEAIFVQDSRQPLISNFRFPFFGVGKVISQRRVHGKQKGNRSCGTGCLIGINVVITNAHIVAEDITKNSTNPCQTIYFQAQTSQGARKTIRVKECHINQMYFKTTKTSSRFDIAVLVLQQNSIIKPEQVLPIKLDYIFQQYKASEILISGYPGDKNILNKYQIQYWSQQPAIKLSKQNILYRHATYNGNSGSPLMLKLTQFNVEQYQVIGLHVGSCQEKNFNHGMLLSTRENKEFLLAILSSIKHPSINNNQCPGCKQLNRKFNHFIDTQIKQIYEIHSQEISTFKDQINQLEQQVLKYKQKSDQDKALIQNIKNQCEQAIMYWRLQLEDKQIKLIEQRSELNLKMDNLRSNLIRVQRQLMIKQGEIMNLKRQYVIKNRFKKRAKQDNYCQQQLLIMQQLSLSKLLNNDDIYPFCRSYSQSTLSMNGSHQTKFNINNQTAYKKNSLFTTKKHLSSQIALGDQNINTNKQEKVCKKLFDKSLLTKKEKQLLK